MFDLDRFLADCRTALAAPAPEVQIKELVERAVAHPREIEAALGTPHEGGLTTLHHGPDLTVLNVVWTPGMAIHPHDHRMWAIIGLYGGREDNVFYRRAPRGLAVAGARQLETGHTTVLGHAVIHAVSNPLRRFAAAIHIYGGDFFATPRSEWTPDTLQERPFDVAHTRQVFADANERWRRECAGRPESPAHQAAARRPQR